MPDKMINYSHPMPTTKRRADLDGADFYPTPAWATFALILKEIFHGNIWECACGDGAMSEALKVGNEVISTDLYDHGYGNSGVDFLKTDLTADNIVTNPPFHSAENFLLTALPKAKHKVCLLLRLAFLESGARHKNIFTDYAPDRIHVFSERVTFYPKGAERKGSGTTSYAWFVWDKIVLPSRDRKTLLGWIEPGAKARYQAWLKSSIGSLDKRLNTVL